MNHQDAKDTKKNHIKGLGILGVLVVKNICVHLCISVVKNTHAQKIAKKY